jgi:catechol 2,3-dioxygenase-like lactoylglutathione lyase family enzyme
MEMAISEPRVPQTEPDPSPIAVQKLGHVVYEVSDMQRSVKFWTEVMGFKVSDVNEWGMVFLRCAQDHHTIALKEVKGLKRPAKDQGLQIDHMAFAVDRLETLFAAREYLKRHDIPIVFEGRRGPGCNIGVEFLDPDGYLIEIYWGMDQIGPDGRSRPAEQFRRARSLEEAVANPLPERW